VGLWCSRAGSADPSKAISLPTRPSPGGGDSRRQPARASSVVRVGATTGTEGSRRPRAREQQPNHRCSPALHSRLPPPGIAVAIHRPPLLSPGEARRPPPLLSPSSRYRSISRSACRRSSSCRQAAGLGFTPCGHLLVVLPLLRAGVLAHSDGRY